MIRKLIDSFYDRDNIKLSNKDIIDKINEIIDEIEQIKQNQRDLK